MKGGGVFTRDSDGLPVDDGVPRGDRSHQHQHEYQM